MEPRALIMVDWYRTLSNDRFWNTPSVSLMLQARIACAFLKSRDRIERWMRGSHTYHEMCAWLARMLEVDCEFMAEALQKSCESMQLDESIVEQLKRLRKRAAVILVTDNMDCFSTWVTPRLIHDRIFDDVVNSYELRRLKNDELGKTFQDCIKRFSSIPAQTWLLDDSKESCSNIQAIGGNALRVECAADLRDHLLAVEAILEEKTH